MLWKDTGIIVIILQIVIVHSSTGCQFYPPGEYLRFVRVPENWRVGDEILKIDVYPRNNLILQPIDRADDVYYFTYRDLNRTTVSLLLARSLEDIVDTDNPRNVLKFKISCDYYDGEDTITSSLSVTVYVEDVNDHAPIFFGAPYQITVDELTPVGLTIFRGIHATDRDKPNTPNSDVQYSIVAGNERGKFALDSSHQAYLILKKTLDFDSGDRQFLLTITASDRGLPPKSTNTTILIRVTDNDDLSPKFTKGVYRTRINEFYPITGERIHQELIFDPPIYAFDQDVAIDTPIRYDIIAGNDRNLFSMNHLNGTMYLEREIDIDNERSLPGNTFVLQIQASQIDNPMKFGVARVEIEIIDLNDNLPEFEVDFYNISIVENLPNGFSVLQILATDQDQGDNADFSYQLDDKSGAFALDSVTGWLTVRDQSVLDREKRSTITMRVYAKEKVASVVTDRLGASFVNIEVTLLDANDNNPTFIPNNLYHFVVNTDAKYGDVVGQVYAIDPDLGRNGMVTYTIQKAPNNTVPFKIDTKTGKITVSQTPLLTGKHLLFIEAGDQPLNPSEKRSSLAVVSIEVQSHVAKNDQPDFIGAPYEFWVGGNVGIGTSVGQIRITDAPDRRQIVYDLLHSYHEGVPFAVEERSGTITVIDELGKYTRQNYDFEAVVTDDKDVFLQTNVTIHVVDPNDEKTILMKTGTTPIEFHVRENLKNSFIGKLGFRNGSSDALTFSIANRKDVDGYISLTTDGALYTEKALDRESRDVYHLTVIAEYKKGLITGTGIYQVVIYVDDENDNKPTFDRLQYIGKITENCVAGTEVDLNYLIHVSDKDSGPNGQFSLTIFGNGSEMFRLDRNSGKIFFASAERPLDRESVDVYNLRLVAKDKGGLYDEAKLTINIDDENDNPPVFLQFIIYQTTELEIVNYDSLGNRIGHFDALKNSTNNRIYVLSQPFLRSKRAKLKNTPIISLKEDINIGTVFIKLIAEDRDLGENAIIKYETVSETYIPNKQSTELPFHLTQYFMVQSNSGEISVARTLPPESEFRLNISATDRGGLKDFLYLRLLIVDVNNHPPIFKKSWYNFDVEEAFYQRHTLGKIEAIDGDFGPNANISYRIQNNDDGRLPFTVAPLTGILTIDGLLDRETKDKYSFIITAKDNPIKGVSQSSSVTVDVNILDVNDNPPMFYGYDELIPNPDANIHNNHNYQQEIPVYYGAVAENSPIGTPVTRIFANDSDFIGNGNGLLLFDIPYRKNHRQNRFTIDSKEGVITTIAQLDYEQQHLYNITVIASDLGSPSLTSTALLIVNVIDVPEDIQSMEQVAIFAHRYYEIEVEENVPVPLKVLTLNVSEPYRSHKLRYSIVGDRNSEIKRTFQVDPRNGSLFIIESPDRERKDRYELTIRLDQYKVGRDMTVMIYPVTNERLGNLGLNEVKVIVRVTDVNDNIPKFTISGRPIIAAIPSTASYGYHIVTLQAKDPDDGVNSEIRYQILGRADDDDTTRRFAIDPLTGQVRSVVNFAKDAGKVYGFDVKATDRRGADDGRSSIANVVVYVLDDQRQLVMVMGMKPTEVERCMENITQTLFNVTGFDVRVRKLEPHLERNQIDNSVTDMYLYAVDPLLNTVIDVDQLLSVLQTKQEEIEEKLEGTRVLAFTSPLPEKDVTRNQRIILLTSLEVGIVVLGCVVFIGALTTAICVMCIRRKKRRLLRENFSQPLSFTLPPNTMTTATKSGLFSGSGYAGGYGEPLHYSDVGHDLVHGGQHDINCPRIRRLPLLSPPFRERSRSSGCVEKSITSLHSSGHDSGIVDTTIHCQCGQSSSQSEDSSNYEDSLQSVPRRKMRNSSSSTCRQEITATPSAGVMLQRRLRNRSISDDMLVNSYGNGGGGGGLYRMRSIGHITAAPPPIFASERGSLRRSSDRLVIASPDP